MDENINTTETGISLAKIFKVLKKNLFFIFIIVLLTVGCGVVYTKYTKPVYTASEAVSYDSTIISDNSDKEDNKSSVTMMHLYFPTVVGYCETGGVLDRADFYYSKYLQLKANDIIESVQDFIDMVIDGQVDYVISDDFNRVHYSQSKVSSSTIDDEIQFIFRISLKDLDGQVAREKLRILVLAFDVEIENSFGGVVSNIKEYVDNENQISVSSNVSLTKNIIFSGVLGITLALGLVYIKMLLDNTIKEKDELEEITGCNLLAVINKNAEK